jgi:hypothetical protein
MVTWYWIENSISQECNGIRSIALFASAIVQYVLLHCTLCVFGKSRPSKYFSYESISLFWYYIKRIMNVYSCNGKNIFIRWKMECSIQLGHIHYLYTSQLSSTVILLSTLISCHTLIGELRKLSCILSLANFHPLLTRRRNLSVWHNPTLQVLSG